MNNNQISNQKVQVPTGMNLNDLDHIGDLLSTLKCMVKDYTVALTEASNETLFNEYKQIFDKLISLQRETYELMFRYGWYSLEKAEDTKISNKFQTLKQKFTDLNG